MILRAIESDDLETIKSIYSSAGSFLKADFRDGLTPLMYASVYGYEDIVSFLISFGTDVNEKDDGGETPLLYASANNKDDVTVVELLLSHGADINARNNYGMTPLRYAALLGNCRIAKLLISKGCDVNDQVAGDMLCHQGTTPLMLACSYGGQIDIVRLLISHGADVNIMNWCGGMALHAATYFGNREITELLVAAGADIDALDQNRCSPLWYATKFGYKGIADILSEHGAAPLRKKTYTVVFTGLQHPVSMKYLKDYFGSTSEIKVVEISTSRPIDSIKTLAGARADVIYTCNETSAIFSKISLLLHIPLIRIQEDPPQNSKWRKSFLYDMKSPLSYIQTLLDVGSLGELANDKLISKLLLDRRLSQYCSGSPPLTDYMCVNPLFVMDDKLKIKDIDIVFIGNIGNWTPENLLEEMSSRFKDAPGSLLVKIAQKIISHSIEFMAEISDIKDSIEGLDFDTYNSLLYFYYEAIGRLRRINILRFVVQHFGEKYCIHLYGHENLAEIISRKHYKGFLYDQEAVKDIYRRSKIAVYSNSRPPLYNWGRFLEPYKYGCVGIVDYTAMSEIEVYKLHGRVARTLNIVPIIKKMNSLAEIIPSCLDDSTRTRLVSEVLAAGLLYSKVNIAPLIGQYMCLFDYMKNSNINYSPYDFEMLRYDSEVVVLCEDIAKCYREAGDGEKVKEFEELGDYFLTVLKNGCNESKEAAYEYAYLYFCKGDYNETMRIIEAHCPDLDRARILKAKVLRQEKKYQEAINVLSGIDTDDSEVLADKFFYLGLTSHAMGELLKAVAFYAKAAEIGPDRDILNYYIGLAYFHLNRWIEAKGYFQEAFRKIKNMPDINMLLGDVHLFLHEYDDAIGAYKYGLAANDTYEGDRVKEIMMLEKLSIAYLFKGEVMNAINSLQIILNKCDRNHLVSHVKIFLLFLSQNIFNNNFTEKLKWLKKNNIPLFRIYETVRAEFPEDINKSIVDNVLNISSDEKVLFDFQNELRLKYKRL